MKRNQLLISLLTAGMLVLTPALAQDVVKLTTSKAVGEKIQLRLNQQLSGVTVDWGDGSVVTVPATTAELLLVEGTVKGSGVVTVTADNSTYRQAKITTLICSGNALTALDVTGAPNLRSLYCQDNELTALDLSKCAKLTDLDCSSNKITTLRITETTHPKLENFNVASNALINTIGSGSSFALRNKCLQHVDISGNQLKSATIGTLNTNLDVLKCANNALSSLTLTSPDSLSVLMAGGNDLTRITMPSDGQPALRYVFLDDNQLTKLDFSASKELQYLSVANNKLSYVHLPAKTKMNSYVCGNNMLTASSLPTLSYKPENMTYLPQADEVDITSLLKKASNGDYYMPLCPSYTNRQEDAYQLDLSQWVWDTDDSRTSIVVNYYGKSASGDFAKLTKATKSGGDYFAATSNTDYGKVSFLSAQDEVYVEFSSKYYPDLVSHTTHFKVIDPASGIGSVKTAQGLKIVAGHRAIVISTDSGEEAVRIYSTAGKLVWQGRASVTATTVTLPAGLYIVNGQKVVI